MQMGVHFANKQLGSGRLILNALATNGSGHDLHGIVAAVAPFADGNPVYFAASGWKERHEPAE
jgi:hypothetical protein